MYVGALFHWCGCCRVYFNDNAGRDYPSSSCDCRRFSAIRESQKERYVIVIELIFTQAIYSYSHLSAFYSGYVRFLTNFGALNLELYCDMVPKTCENFMKHCQNGYYDGTKFHRSIRNFMVSILSATSLLNEF